MLADSSRFRQVAGGWSIRLAALAFAVSALLRPDWTHDEAELVARLAADHDEQLAATLLGLAGCALAVPAVLTLMHMLRERRIAAGHVVGIVSLVGVAGLGFHYIVELAVWVLAEPGPGGQLRPGPVDRLLDDPFITAGFDYLPLALGAGLAALGVVLRAADALEPWTAYTLVLGAPTAAVGLFIADATVLIVGWGVVLAGANKIGKRVLAQDDADWRHWPSWTFSWSWKR